LHIKPVLAESTPYFAVMTAICAGDKRKVKLGDLVLAASAFAYDTGKIVIGKDGKPQLLHELDTWNASPEVLQFARMFHLWQDTVASIALPSVNRQQADGLPYQNYKLLLSLQVLLWEVTIHLRKFVCSCVILSLLI
jgi:hypothetical protein